MCCNSPKSPAIKMIYRCRGFDRRHISWAKFRNPGYIKDTKLHSTVQYGFTLQCIYACVHWCLYTQTLFSPQDGLSAFVLSKQAGICPHALSKDRALLSHLTWRVINSTYRLPTLKHPQAAILRSNSGCAPMGGQATAVTLILLFCI